MPLDSSTGPPSRPRPRRPCRRLLPVELLLGIPFLALAWPPLYNRAEPSVLGIPFFYAYQLAMIPVAVICMLLVYRARRRR